MSPQFKDKKRVIRSHPSGQWDERYFNLLDVSEPDDGEYTYTEHLAWFTVTPYVNGWFRQRWEFELYVTRPEAFGHHLTYAYQKNIKTRDEAVAAAREVLLNG